MGNEKHMFSNRQLNVVRGRGHGELVVHISKCDSVMALPVKVLRDFEPN
jgi:hypothetical protein